MKFLIGNKKEFLDFLELISKNDDVGILTHTDLDGISSVIFLEEILEKKGLKVSFIDFLGYKKRIFEDIFDELNKRKINKLFITDVGADGIDLEGFEKIRKKIDTFLIDHHPIYPNLGTKKNIIKTETFNCSALTVYELGEKLFDRKKWEWLVCATMISDMSFKDSKNLKFIQDKYENITKENIFDSIPGKISRKISSGLIYYAKNKKKVYDLVKNKDIGELGEVDKKVNAEVLKWSQKAKQEMEFYPDRNLYFYYFNPNFNVTSIVTTILSGEKKDKTFVFCSDMEKGLVKISARNQNSVEDTNVLMKKGIEGLENASAGGHIPASAGTIMKKDLKKFKENILK